MGAAVTSRTVFVAAKLGIADQLASGPKSASELAGPMQVHAPSLHRLMRTLASLGILTEQSAQRFALTSLGEALKTGAPGSARSTLLVFGSAWQRSAWDHMEYSVQTGQPGFDKAHGVPPPATKRPGVSKTSGAPPIGTTPHPRMSISVTRMSTSGSSRPSPP